MNSETYKQAIAKLDRETAKLIESKVAIDESVPDGMVRTPAGLMPVREWLGMNRHERRKAAALARKRKV